mmetsp:Transcript_5409/g.12022  ORF Transcript_5409/g.12022 Transcript_5409/m.12022 type:complete len:91 (-) Transcript_5409:2471-2743(-)
MIAMILLNWEVWQGVIRVTPKSGAQFDISSCNLYCIHNLSPSIHRTTLPGRSTAAQSHHNKRLPAPHPAFLLGTGPTCWGQMVALWWRGC